MLATRVSPYGPASAPLGGSAAGDRRRRNRDSTLSDIGRATSSHAAIAVTSASPGDGVRRREARKIELARSHGVPICVVCSEPIRGMVCFRGASQVHFGCGGASQGEELELDSLEPCQERALHNVREATRILHDAALPRLRERVEALGFHPHDADTTLTWIREHAPVIIHVDLCHFGQKLAADTHYRNQFETSCSRGCLSTASRTRWEEDLFGDAYRDASAFARCKYGVLNVTNDPRGVRACSQYGSCYLLLRNVRFRTTFSAQDSAGLCIDRLATVDYHAHVLEHYQDDELQAAVEVGIRQAFGRDSRAITKYKEAQIHGEVRLADHVELIMAHPSLRQDSRSGTNARMLEKLSERCGGAPVVWMEGGASESDMGMMFDDADGPYEDVIPPAPPVWDREASALPSEDEDLMRAITASQLLAKESRAAKEAENIVEARDLELAIELSQSLDTEENIALAIHSSFSPRSSNSVAADSADSDLARAITASLLAAEDAKRQKTSNDELEEEVALFAVDCMMECGACERLQSVVPDGRSSTNETPMDAEAGKIHVSSDDSPVVISSSYFGTVEESADDELMRAIAASELLARETQAAQDAEEAHLKKAMELSVAQEARRTLKSQDLSRALALSEPPDIEEDTAMAVRSSLAVPGISGDVECCSVTVSVVGSEMAPAVGAPLLAAERSRYCDTTDTELKEDVVLCGAHCATESCVNDFSATAAYDQVISEVACPAEVEPAVGHSDLSTSTEESPRNAKEFFDTEGPGDACELCPVCDGSGVLLQDPCPLCSEAVVMAPVHPIELPPLECLTSSAATSTAVVGSSLPPICSVGQGFSDVDAVHIGSAMTVRTTFREAGSAIALYVFEQSCKPVGSKLLASCDECEKSCDVFLEKDASVIDASLVSGLAASSELEVDDEALAIAVKESLQAAEEDLRLEALELEELAKAIKVSEGIHF